MELVKEGERTARQAKTKFEMTRRAEWQKGGGRVGSLLAGMRPRIPSRDPVSSNMGAGLHVPARSLLPCQPQPTTTSQRLPTQSSGSSRQSSNLSNLPIFPVLPIATGLTWSAGMPCCKFKTQRGSASCPTVLASSSPSFSFIVF